MSSLSLQWLCSNLKYEVFSNQFSVALRKHPLNFNLLLLNFRKLSDLLDLSYTTQKICHELLQESCLTCHLELRVRVPEVAFV